MRGRRRDFCGKMARSCEGGQVSTRQLSSRLKRVERRMFPERNESVLILEELCRAIWREDEKTFRTMSSGNDCSLRHFIPQFEREDLLERSRRAPILR